MASIVLDNFCPNRFCRLTYRDIWVNRLKWPTVYMRYIYNLDLRLIFSMWFSIKMHRAFKVCDIVFFPYDKNALQLNTFNAIWILFFNFVHLASTRLNFFNDSLQRTSVSLIRKICKAKIFERKLQTRENLRHHNYHKHGLCVRTINYYYHYLLP